MKVLRDDVVAKSTNDHKLRRQIADTLGVDTPAVYMAFRRKSRKLLTFDVLQVMAAYYGCEIEDLVTESHEKV